MPTKNRGKILFCTLDGKPLAELGDPVSIEAEPDKNYWDETCFVSVGQNFEGKLHIMTNNERRRRGLPLMRGRLNGNRTWRMLLKYRGRK